jgi:hypothetical protein
MFRYLALLVFAASLTGAPAAARDAQTPWLAISDIHYGPGPSRRPSHFGRDTNFSLLLTMLAEARLVDPNPPVVVLSGDFLAHGLPDRDATATMLELAQRFNETFPHAQFLITLGNNDSNCGDYQAPIDGPFLAAIAKAWEPLVNRRGAAPDFAKRFAHDGGYVARLPLPGLRAVVANDVVASLRYGNACAGQVDAPAEVIAGFRRDLDAGKPDERTWTLFHIPPGIDAYSTTYLAHRLGIVPFLQPSARESLDAALADPRHHVTLAIAGHTHKFSFRIDGYGNGRVPMLLVPSVSPIFNNGPSFLTLDVASDTTLSNATEWTYVHRKWQRLGDLRTLGVARFTVPELEALQGRLARDPALRATFSRMYSGAGPAEITPGNWRSYWCAVDNLSSTAYERCTGQGGFSIITDRGLVLAGVLAALVAGCAGVFFFLYRRTRGARAG